MLMQSEKSMYVWRYHRKMHSIECIEYCTKDQSNVEDVEDRSNTPKGCNAMYVGDVEDGKRTYTHILAHNFLNT